MTKKSYESAWRDLRRRCLLIEVVLLLILAALFLWPVLHYLMPALLASPLASRLKILLAMLLAVAGVAVVIYGGRFRCPRCGGAFFGREHNLRAQKCCSQCDLPINSPSNAEENDAK